MTSDTSWQPVFVERWPLWITGRYVQVVFISRWSLCIGSSYWGVVSTNRWSLCESVFMYRWFVWTSGPCAEVVLNTAFDWLLPVIKVKSEGEKIYKRVFLLPTTVSQLNLFPDDKNSSLNLCLRFFLPRCFSFQFVIQSKLYFPIFFNGW